MTIKATVLICTVIGVLTTAAGCATTRASTSGETLELSIPDVAGKNVETSEYRGRVVLVDVWATWCKPCLASMPFYASLYERHREKGFEVLAISVDEHDDEVTTFLAKTPLPFRVLRDRNGSFPERLAVDTMPTAFLLDRNGKIAQRFPGFDAAHSSQIEAAVESLLATATSSATAVR